MDWLYPAVFSHSANFISIAWFKASISTHPPLIPVVKSLYTYIKKSIYFSYITTPSPIFKLHITVRNILENNNRYRMANYVQLYYNRASRNRDFGISYE